MIQLDFRSQTKKSKSDSQCC